MGIMAYAGLCLVVFLLQRSFIYFPRAVPAAVPNAIDISAGDRTVRVAARQQAATRAIVYLGGNAEDVAYSLEEFSQQFPDHALYMMYYRGYGGTAGRPNESGLVADARAVCDWVRERHPQIVLVGRSIGSGIAVQVAAEREFERLVLVTPFDSLVTLAWRQFPYLPVGPLLRDRYESWRFAARIATPTLIVAAEHDEIVPRSSTDRLVDAFPPGVATLRLIAGATHNDLAETGEYPALIVDDRPRLSK